MEICRNCAARRRTKRRRPSRRTYTGYRQYQCSCPATSEKHTLHRPDQSVNHPRSLAYLIRSRRAAKVLTNSLRLIMVFLLILALLPYTVAEAKGACSARSTATVTRTVTAAMGKMKVGYHVEEGKLLYRLDLVSVTMLTFSSSLTIFQSPSRKTCT